MSEAANLTAYTLEQLQCWFNDGMRSMRHWLSVDTANPSERARRFFNYYRGICNDLIKELERRRNDCAAVAIDTQRALQAAGIPYVMNNGIPCIIL
jgi:hypothetical protein